MNKIRMICIAAIILITTEGAWGHGFDLSVDNFADPTEIVPSSQSDYLDPALITPSPLANLFIENFSGTLTSGYYYVEHGFAQTAGAFPNYSGATFNITSPLYFSDGSIGSSVFAQATPASNGTYIHIYDRDYNPNNGTAIFPGATGGTVDVVGNRSFTPGFGVSLYDAHELAKELFLGGGPGFGEYGFSYTISIPFTLGDGSHVTLTTVPLVDIFSMTDQNQGDFSDNAPYAQQDAATLAIYDAIMQGDFNLDGHKTVADVQAMLAALADLPGYQASHDNMVELELQAIGDLDRDGAVTNADVQGLLSLLANAASQPGGATTNVVPEPGAWLLAGIGIAISLATRIAHGNRPIASRE